MCHGDRQTSNDPRTTLTRLSSPQRDWCFDCVLVEVDCVVKQEPPVGNLSRQWGVPNRLQANNTAGIPPCVFNNRQNAPCETMVVCVSTCVSASTDNQPVQKSG